MSRFHTPVSIFEFDNVKSFAHEFEIKQQDVILTHKFLAEPYLKPLGLPCSYIYYEDHETGEPIATVSVVLSPGGKTKTTGTDGRYEFLDLDPQQYTITVQKTGYQTNRKTVTAVVGKKTEANIPLTKSN